MSPGELAAAAVLHREDLGDGWRVAPAEAGITDGHGDALLDQCLGTFLEEHPPLGAADSARFVRPPSSLAYSTALVHDSAAIADAVAAHVRSDRFAACFGDAVAGGVDVAPGGAELLGATVRRLSPELHRVTFAGGTGAGLVGVHVDLAVLSSGPCVTLVWLADSPDPFADADRVRVLDALRRRLVRITAGPR